MFSLKKKYFFIIKSIKDINLKIIKKHNKFIIIYRYEKKPENIEDLLRFRKNCKLKTIKFYVANDLNLATFLKSDGIYLSSYNKSFKFLSSKRNNFKIIGSAHNLNEISIKKKQGCNIIIFSKLFLVDYDKKAKFIGILKFNYLLKTFKYLVPLGGINSNNLNNLKNVNSLGFAMFSEIKKKPAIASRLF